nr:MAG TPA: tail protein [Caudoviricetes sp.]
MDNKYENIVPWNGVQDTGRDVRLKLERNFGRIGLNFEEVMAKFSDTDDLFVLIAEELEKKLSKDKPDSTDHLTGFNVGITIARKEINGVIISTDADTDPSDTSVYTSLSVDTIITALEDKYIRKDKEDSTLYPVDFRNGLLINSKRIDDIIRYYDEDKPVATDANIYSALQTDQRIEDELNPLEDKYIRKDQPDSTLYPVDFTAGLSINSKRIGDIIRYYDENKPVATDANIYSALQTDQRIDEEFGKIDDRYIRKDKEDIAHKHITFEDGITVYQLAEMMNVDVKNLATIAKAVVSILRSSKFVDGFSGEGYQIWQDIATGDWNMTLDRLTVRKVLTIYELVLQKIRSVGGMVVVSAANGKVKSVERIGNNYLFTFEDTNQFQPDDFMRCQVFSPSGLKYYWVKVASVSGESVIVPLSEFDGVIPAAGDEVVLMGNATDKRRQSLILISATEDGQPRFDCLDGVKSKNLEGCLKVRVGSLDGISDSRFPADMQPSGYGLYGNNCFLTGIFVLSNGKDVMTMFSIMEGMIKSEISSVRNEINAKDNYLSNASFSGDLMDWSSTNRVRVFRVDNRLLSFNNNFYANKENLASITLEDGRSVLRLKNSSITQYNSNFARYPKFDEKIKYEEVEVPVLDADGNPVLDESGQPVTELQEVPVLDGEGNTVMIKIPRQFYISFNYMVKRTGTLTVYFKNESSDESGNSYKEEFESYDPIYFVKSLLPTSGFQKMEIAGKWNGKGHFYLAFTGDMYLYSLALADNPLAEMEEKFTMRFEATDKKIQANLDEIKKTGTKLEEYHSEFLLTARNLQTKFTEDLSDAESRITAAYKSYVNLTARDLTVQFQADINNAETRITEAYTSAIELSAKGLQTKFTADLTDMEAGITAAYKSYVNLTAQNLEAGFTEDLTDLRTGVTEAYKAAIDLSARGLRADFNSSIADLNGKLTTHTSSFHVTASKIEAMVTATDNISNTIRTAGWITTADGNKLWATLKQYNELHDLVSVHTSSFHVTATKIEAMVSATDNINNTIKTAGWITTADGNKLWATISTVDELGNKLTTHTGSFHVTASKIEAMVSATDSISNTIRTAGWITTADGNKLWATLNQYNELNQVVSTHKSSFHVTATQISSMVESIDANGRNYSSITQTVGEIRADVNDVSGKYANLSLKVDAISAVVGDGTTGSFSEFLQTVNEISASVTEVKNGLDTHKGSFHVTASKIEAMVSATDSISNTIRTAGWITTADGNKLWATLNQYNELNQAVSSHTGSFHVTADKIEAMVTATDNISNTIKTAGWITKSDGNTWWASKGTEQTASDAAKSAINAATAAADAMTRANSAYDKADDTATALVQTNSSLSAIAGRFNADGTLKEGAGWVTTADAAALYATKQTVNSLGERVTTAESRITANADSISLTVKKDGIISAINQTAESVTIDASKINLNGVVTANDYFRINLDGSISAKAGTLGGLKISGEYLTNEGFNNDACIILRNDTHNTFAGIGGNTLPATSGIRAVARFSNEESGGYWGNTNVAMMVSAKNATWNRAIVATGDILTNGLNIGYRFHEYSFTANNQWQKPSVLKSDILYVYFNYSNCAFVLPTLREVCESLGISYSTPFAIRLTVISSSGDGKLYGRNKTIAGTSGYEYPELMSWTGGIDTSGYNVSSHDSFEVCLFYNGGSSYIPSNEGAYRAYITGALR